MAIVIVVAWIVCGVLAGGISFSHFQHEWPQFAWPYQREDAGFAVLVSVCGPFGLIAILLVTGFARHGISFRPLSAEESWAEHQRRYPSLSRENWRRT